MALQAKVDSLDSVPEILRSDYVAIDPADPSKGYQLLIEDPKDPPEVSALKQRVKSLQNSLSEFRTSNIKFKQELETLRSVPAPAQTPPTAPAAPTQAAEIDLRAVVEPVRAEYEGRLAAMQKEMQDRENVIKRQEQLIQAEHKHRAIRMALEGSKIQVVSPGAYDDLSNHMLSRMKVDDNGRVYVMDGNDRVRYSGKNAAEPMSVTEFLHEMTTERSYLFGESRGGNAAGSRVISSIGLGNSIPKSAVNSSHIDALARGTLTVKDV